MMKIMTVTGPLLHGNGHYMGPDLGLVWQNKGYKLPDFRGSQSDGFTGFFQTSEGGTAGTRPCPDSCGFLIWLPCQDKGILDGYVAGHFFPVYTRENAKEIPAYAVSMSPPRPEYQT
jgi:hypothetical protein